MPDRDPSACVLVFFRSFTHFSIIALEVKVKNERNKYPNYKGGAPIFLCVLALMLRSTLAILLREKAIPFSVNEALKKLDNVKLVELNGKVMKESIGEGSELLSQII